MLKMNQENKTFWKLALNKTAADTPKPMLSLRRNEIGLDQKRNNIVE